MYWGVQLKPIACVAKYDVEKMAKNDSKEKPIQSYMPWGWISFMQYNLHFIKKTSYILRQELCILMSEDQIIADYPGKVGLSISFNAKNISPSINRLPSS